MFLTPSSLQTSVLLTLNKIIPPPTQWFFILYYGVMFYLDVLQINTHLYILEHITYITTYYNVQTIELNIA
jgi:hypothetical protein